MQYTRLGRTGLQVSRLALGMMTYGTSQWRPWILEEDAGRPLVRRAVELGFNFFDTADMYSAGESEVLTGKFVREFCRREEVVIATKLFFPVDLGFKGGYAGGGPQRPNSSGLGRKRIFHAIDASLQRLGTDYVDLYQIHRWDPHTPIEETMEALHDVVKSGKARYIGASSMWAWQFAKAQTVAREHGWTAVRQHAEPLQPRVSRRRARDDPAVPRPGRRHLAVEPAGARLPCRQPRQGRQGARRDARAPRPTTTRSSSTTATRDFRVVQALTKLAGELDVSAATLAYAWLLNKPGVTAPIIGASKPGQLEAAVAALDVSLKPEQIAALEAPMSRIRCSAYVVCLCGGVCLCRRPRREVRPGGG